MDTSGADSFLHTYAVQIFLVCIALVIIWRRQWKDVNSVEGKKRKITQGSWLVPAIPMLMKIESIYTFLHAKTVGVQLLDELTSRFGSVFEMYLGRRKYMAVSDASIIQKIVNSNDPNHLNKDQLIYDKIFVGALNNGLVASEVGVWSPHRKILSRAFTYKSLQSYLPIMNKHTKNMIKHLERVGNQSEDGCVNGIQVCEISNFHTVKIISNIVMGSEDICTDEENQEFHSNFRRWQQIVMGRVVSPLQLIEPIWQIHPRKRELDRVMDNLYKFIRLITSNYVVNKEKELQGLIDWENDGMGIKPFRCMLLEMLQCGMAEQEIYDEVLTMLIAGHETSNVSIIILMLHLALNPDQQAGCREEVDNLFNSQSTDSDFDCDLTMDDLSNLKLVERCILESSRVTPSIPVFIRRLDTPLKIDDEFEIKGNTNIFIIPWSLHRDPKHWPNPEKFDPDRFLPENCRERHPCAYLPFSGGQRNCIGYKMALLEIKMIIAWVLRNFEIYSLDTLDMIKFVFEISLRSEKPIRLVLKKRVGYSS